MTKFKSKKMNKFRKALGIILISLVFLTIIISGTIVVGVISTLISVGIAILIAFSKKSNSSRSVGWMNCD